MKKFVLGVVIVMAATQSAWAARMPIHEAAESADYGRKFGGMLGRGILNVATCPVDLLVNLVNETRNGPPLIGTLVGVSKGVGCTTIRALSGGVDVLTFWVPGFNGFPVSDSYDNCLASSSVPAASSASAPAASSYQGFEHGEEAESMPSTSGSPSSSSHKKSKPRYTK